MSTLTDTDIVEIRDELLPSQGETFDCIAFARAVLARNDAAMPQAWHDAMAERRRQVAVEGWTPEHDDEHDGGEIASAAAAYALAAADALHPLSQGDGDFASLPPLMWPWHREWWKPDEPRRMLVKAAALTLAELERFDREHAHLSGD